MNFCLLPPPLTKIFLFPPEFSHAREKKNGLLTELNRRHRHAKEDLASFNMYFYRVALWYFVVEQFLLQRQSWAKQSTPYVAGRSPQGAELKAIAIRQ